MRRGLLFLTLVLVSVTVSGCVWLLAGAAVGAGVGAYAWYNGELTNEYAASQEKTLAATLEAVKGLSLTVEGNVSDGLVGTVRCFGADGKKIVIRVEAVGESTSRVRIRVGTFGDRDASTRIAEAIWQHLKKK